MDSKNYQRGRILLEALDVINGERQDQYGEPEDSFSTIAHYWSVYLRQKHIVSYAINSDDVAIMMALMKIARMGNGAGTKDSAVDCCGYIALAEDILVIKRGLKAQKEVVNEDAKN